MKKVILTRPSYRQKNTENEHTPSFPSKGGREEGDSSPRIQIEEKEVTSKTLDQAQDLASKLSAADQKKLLDFLSLKLLESGESGQTRDVDMWALAVYEATVAAIGTNGGGMAGPLALKRLLAARSSWGPIETFAAYVGLPKLQVAERQGAYRLLANMLVDRAQGVARAVRAPLTGKLVANNTADIAAIFDASFPGYLAGGLALVVFRRAAQGVAATD